MVIPSISVVVIVALGEVTDLVLEIGPGAVTDPVQVIDLVLEADLVQEAEDQVQEQDQVQGQDQVQEQDQVQDQARAQVQGQVRGKDQVQWIESRHQGNQAAPERVTRVPLVATSAVRQLPETVNAVGRVVAANHVQDRQEVQRAGVVAGQRVVVVAAVVDVVAVDVVVDVDVDLK